jgi:hypothetical protein
MTDEVMALLLRFAHLGAFSVFGGSIVSLFVIKLAADARLEGDHLARVLEALLSVEKLVTAPSAMLLLVSGLLMTYVQDIGVTVLWISAALALWMIGLLVAHTVALPQLRRLTILARTNDADRYHSISIRWRLANS